ncbi:GntR family transcriptional regulator [Gracilibacillus alcaliphilus]|uniref:GntR family transcriptional regulator n=1 Tax=Gracilibacillus alcaliphilus TaxID=1401441 RepID=UPI001959C366|nr:GntR family transcriptional regulator [Gracilibacillus alcaliphilus]MBM7677536.1 GntR family transcriptional regulator [Gracilibacillus alcaliphilus]
MAVYQKIKKELETAIAEGIYQVGDRLPPEINLAKQFNVSRETIRSAIRLLEQAGKVVVRHGVGTFVVTPLPSLPNSLENLMSVTSMILHAGLEDGERREKLRSEVPTDEWKELLQLQQEEKVIIHERIRTANNEPIVFSKNVLSHHLVGNDILKKETIGSLFQYLKNECNIEINKASSEIVVPLHTDPNCQKLLIHPVTTVLLLKQIHYDQNNVPVLYSLDYFRNDIFKFFITRTKN